MTAIADTGAPPREIKARNGLLSLTIRGGTAGTIYAGSLAGHRTGSNLAEIPLSASKRTDLVIRGFVRNEVTITTDVDGDGAAVDADGKVIRLIIEPGIGLGFDTGSGGDEITPQDIGKRVYAYDSNTVYLTDLSDTLSPAGVVHDVDADGKVALDVEEDPLAWMVEGNAAEVFELEDDLASTTTGNGASMVGIEDAGSYFTLTTVEGALAETETRARLSAVTNGKGASLVGIEDAGAFTAAGTAEAAFAELYQHLFSAVGGYIPIPLSAWREVNATGDVGNAAAIGGVLASDTTPVFDAVATSNEHEILWATGNVDPIGVSVVLPRDFDDTADATLDLVVSSGSTNAATIVCASAWSAGAAGSEVSDSTSDAGTKSAIPHTLSVTIDKGDIPAGARRATLRLTPPTHATDTIALHATGIAYKRKLMTS